MQEPETNKPETRNSSFNWFGFKEVLTYYFRKKDPNRPRTSMIKAMHWSNKISITIFLIALIIWIIRRVM